MHSASTIWAGAVRHAGRYSGLPSAQPTGGVNVARGQARDRAQHSLYAAVRVLGRSDKSRSVVTARWHGSGCRMMSSAAKDDGLDALPDKVQVRTGPIGR